MTALRWGSATDPGLVRRTNQDHLLVADRLFAVADGMGGHAGGEVASEVAVDALRDSFDDHQRPPRSADDLLEAMRRANAAVYERSQTQANLRGMGTTMTAAALVVDEGEERLAIANVGDSRAYVFTQGELTQLTEDHSVAEEMVRQGQLAPDEVDTHPQRHILTRAMGILPDVDVDLWEVLPFAGDRILLCSDGLVREVTDDQIAAVLRRLAEPDQAAQELVARARAGGGSDNISVVVVDVVDDGGRALAASEAVAADGEARPEPVRGDEGNMTAAAPAMFSAAPAVPPPAVAPPARGRRVTPRVVLFVILVLGVLAGAAAITVAYARASYYVTLGAPGSGPPSPLNGPTARPLVIYQGRPGGLLWFHPTLAQRTDVTSDQVLASRLADLEKGKVFSGVAAARGYVSNLREEAVQAGRSAATLPPPGSPRPVPSLAPGTTVTNVARAAR